MPSVVSCASSLALDQREIFPTNDPEPPCTNGNSSPSPPTSSVSSAKREKENSLRVIIPEPTSSLPKSAPKLEIPKSTGSDKSTNCSPSPIHQNAYSAINHVIRELRTCTASFQYPEDLDFETSSPNSQSVPKLAYTPRNRPFLEQLRKLESLQEKLDGIDSHGDQGVRKARKETGAFIERALADMEWAQAMFWDKVSTTFKFFIF